MDPAHRRGKCICGVRIAFTTLRVEKRVRGRRDGIVTCIYGCLSLLVKGLSRLIIPVFVLEVCSCSSPLPGQPVTLTGRRLSHTQPTSQMILSFPILSVGFFQLSSFASAEWVFILFFSLLDVVSSLSVRDKLEWLPIV